MTRERTDFWVGLFVLLGGVALVFLALRAGNLSSFSFAPTYTVEARFDNVGGLKVRAPVKSSGVVVGRVAAIGFDNERYQAVATLNVESSYQFPTDSSASILTSGLLGEQYIGLTPGGEDKMLEDGSEIQYTQSAVVLEELISKFLYSSAANSSGNEGAAAASPAAPAPAPAAGPSGAGAQGGGAVANTHHADGQTTPADQAKP